MHAIEEARAAMIYSRLTVVLLQLHVASRGSASDGSAIQPVLRCRDALVLLLVCQYSHC